MRKRKVRVRKVTTLRQAKRIIVGVIGGTVLFLGLLMVILPGPAFVVIPSGLAILATEFAWARRWLRKIKRMVSKPNQNQPPAKQPTHPSEPG